MAFCASPSLGLRGLDSSFVIQRFAGALFSFSAVGVRKTICPLAALKRPAGARERLHEIYSATASLRASRAEGRSILDYFPLPSCSSGSSYRAKDAGLEKFCEPLKAHYFVSL
jgi:hypothetical protein